MSSAFTLLAIFIVFCSLRESGMINAKMQSSSSAKSQKWLLNESYNNLFFSGLFIKLPLSAAHSICSFKCGNRLISTFSSKLGNNLFMSCSFIFRWLRWLFTSSKSARSNRQLLSHKRDITSGSSLFASRKSWIASFKMITDNSQGICTKQNIDRNIVEVYYLALLRSQGSNSPLQIFQCTIGIGWPHLV